jgi:hypothetical protein
MPVHLVEHDGRSYIHHPDFQAVTQCIDLVG